ncbi:S-methyl-5'-thioadenosine phosphorylase [Amycolatopsis sp. 195334CR]|uniref:S-methyl-5'-thioadenosine phosphorylase n=1 Tax=Amycolatopsis sp. 195334CR TaxID=2814588 RepID=UPI001A8D1487|nr:S-methyl-5'-thioadenosine phosphorylase [Amycolatopsis sp. 195334CR]MBN6038803.1 S-methyl-5'-thioadenosine phosphorylase [Amycolatopsis sp. 195334CR]
MTQSAEVGIIGGSGLYALELLSRPRTVELSTPFGPPSGEVVLGELAGREVAFLPRHGKGHRLTPSEVPYAANVHALKSLGVTEILSVSAVGSLREELRPGDLVVPGQLTDLTRGIRRSSFFGDGVVAHLPFADPYCERLRPHLVKAARMVGVTVHDAATYVCIEGPHFSTRAESALYRTWGMDVIGMTAATEAKLAREAGICLAPLALVTDYDCWRDGEAAVTAGAVAETMRRNISAAQAAVSRFLDHAPRAETCDCHDALAHAIMSDTSALPAETRERLELIAGKYLG